MKVAANLTALRALTTDADNYARLLGYASAGDGGGGEWYYDAADTTTPDNSALVVTSGGAGRWKRIVEGQSVNVKWWGAVGNEAADDTAAVQACVTYVCGLGYATKPEIIVPHGYYRITDTITFPNARGIIFRGSAGQQGGGSAHVSFIADIASAASGAAASIATPVTVFAGSNLTGEVSYRTTITGLSGITSGMEGSPIYFPSPTNPANFGAWTIIQYLSATSVVVEGRYGEQTMVAESGLTWHVANKPAFRVKGHECRMIGIHVMPTIGRVLYAGFIDTYDTSAICVENSFEYCRVADEGNPNRHLIYGFIHADHPTQTGLGSYCTNSGGYAGYGNGDNTTYDNCTAYGAVNAGYWCSNELQQTFKIVFNRCLFYGETARTISAVPMRGKYGLHQFGGGMVLRDCEIQTLRCAGVRLMPGCQLWMENTISEHCPRLVVTESTTAFPISVMILGGRYAPSGEDLGDVHAADNKYIKLDTGGAVTVIGARMDGGYDIQVSTQSPDQLTYHATQATWIGCQFSNSDPFAEPTSGNGCVSTRLGCNGFNAAQTGVDYIDAEVAVPKLAAIARYPTALTFGRGRVAGSLWSPTTGVVSGTDYADSDGGTTTVVDADPSATVLEGSVFLPSAPTDGQIWRVRDMQKSAVRRTVTINGNGKNIDGSPTVTIPNVGTTWFKFSTLANEWKRTVRY